MAQTGLIMSDDGKVFSAKNVSSTTAISAGDLLTAPTNNDVFGSTLSRSTYAWDDIKVKRMADSATGYTQFVGIALGDAGTSASNASGVSVCMEGLFMHQASANIEAGSAVVGAASANKLAVATTALMPSKIGRALTGATADTKLVVWKLGL